MTGRENRQQRREAERKARKLANRQESRTPLPVPPAEPSAPLPSSNTPARLAEMRAQAERELEAEFGPELLARAQKVGDRLGRHVGLEVSTRNRTEANRQNAQLSTGPRTEGGKLASSRNSLKHGLSTGTLLIPGEDQTDFEALRDALRRDHQPANVSEQLLVDGMAQSHWLLQRALRFQNDCFTADENGVDEKRLALFLRYGATHERAFHKALSTLLRLQKDRRKAQPTLKVDSNPGFVSQNGPSFSAQRPTLGFVSQDDPNPKPYAASFDGNDTWKSDAEGETVAQAA